MGGCPGGIIAASWAATSAVKGGSSGVIRAMTPPSTHTPNDASASISEALAGVLGTGGGEGRGPLGGPPHERAQRAVDAVAQLGEGVGGVRLLLDEGGVEQLGQPLPQHAGGHVVAALLQRTEPDRPVSQFPDDPQVPPAAEQVEGGHQWPAGARPSDRPSRPGCRHPPFRPVLCFGIRHTNVHVIGSISEAFWEGLETVVVHKLMVLYL